MALFRYEGILPGGEVYKGTVEAPSKEDAVAVARKTCEKIVTITEAGKPLSIGGPTGLSKVSAKSLSLMCRQFSITLKAGFPLVQTARLVAEQTEDKAVQKTLDIIVADIDAGWSFSHSVAEHAQHLPVMFRETVRAGEESGDLAKSFENMSKYYDRAFRTKSKVVSALVYPAFVLAVAAVVMGIIMTFAVPAFTRAFRSMGANLPMPTRIIIGTSKFFTSYGLHLLFGITLFIIICVGMSRTQRGGDFFSKMAISMPVVGAVIQMAGAGQFAQTMSLMLGAGMQILGAMDVSAKAVSSRVMSDEVLGCLPGVEGGRTLGECLAETKWMPKMLVNMVAIGESSGSMEQTLDVLAEYYDNEVQVKSDRALAILEPAIICVLAVVVVLILFAVYLPMFSMSRAIRV